MNNANFYYIGIALTCAALLGGFSSFRRGNKAMGNNFLKLRVAAQGGTIAAMLLGATYMGENKHKQLKEQAEQERLRKEAQREAWLSELDEIDRIEKEIAAKRAGRKLKKTSDD